MACKSEVLFAFITPTECNLRDIAVAVTCDAEPAAARRGRCGSLTACSPAVLARRDPAVAFKRGVVRVTEEGAFVGVARFRRHWSWWRWRGFRSGGGSRSAAIVFQAAVAVTSVGDVGTAA